MYNNLQKIHFSEVLKMKNIIFINGTMGVGKTTMVTNLAGIYYLMKKKDILAKTKQLIDAELQKKSLGCGGNVAGSQIRNCHADGAGHAAPEAAQQQRSHNGRSVEDRFFPQGTVVPFYQMQAHLLSLLL